MAETIVCLLIVLLPVIITCGAVALEFLLAAFLLLIDAVCAMAEGFMSVCTSLTAKLAHRRLARQSSDERSIAALEIHSANWIEIRMNGGEPVWHEAHGWVDLRDVCPCGYVTECAVWCGPGHETGQCVNHRHGYPAIGVTAVEFADGIRQAFRDAGGAM